MKYKLPTSEADGDARQLRIGGRGDGSSIFGRDSHNFLKTQNHMQP